MMLVTTGSLPPPPFLLPEAGAAGATTEGLRCVMSEDLVEGTKVGSVVEMSACMTSAVQVQCLVIALGILVKVVVLHHVPMVRLTMMVRRLEPGIGAAGRRHLLQEAEGAT